MNPFKIEIIREQALELKRKGYGYKNIAKILGVSTMTAWRIINKPDNFGGKFNTNLNLKPSKELAYVLGALLGDGSLVKRKDRRGFSFFVKDKEFAEEFVSNLSKILKTKIELKRYESNIGGKYHLIKYGVEKTSLYLFYDFCKDWKNIEYVANKFPIHFLKGIYDAEGWVTFMKKKNGKRYPWIGLGNSNLKLIKLVSKLLDKLGIEHHIYVYHRKGKKHKIGNHIIIAKKDIYEIRISSISNIKKFYNLIGFTIRRKRNKLEEYFHRSRNG